MPRAKCGKSTERTVDFYLTEYRRISEVFDASDGTYGRRRIHDELKDRGAMCLIASNLRIGTAVGILDQIGTGRKPHVQRRAEKDRDRDLRQVRP